jgi:hypothetical protein
MIALLIAAVLLASERGGVEFTMEAASKTIDPAKSVFLQVVLKAPRGSGVKLPDLRDRTVGFSLAEDFVEETRFENDGKTEVQTANWRLLSEPCAEVYKIKPFVVGDEVVGPVYFEPPAAREPVTGGMEVELRRDFPPLSWRLAGIAALCLLGAALALRGLWALGKYVLRRVREHRMSPIERAWAELGRLIEKGLPGRGRYKDFYVELTMVVRRYIQRRYGIRAPHMTTEEFLATAKPSDSLRRFLESADMVKFAGVEATVEMAEEATAGARDYLNGEQVEHGKKAKVK